MKDRKYFLDTAEALINGDRAKEYGPAKREPRAYCTDMERYT